MDLGRRDFLIPAAVLVLVAASVVTVAFFVDFRPQVEADFFFSTDDPQLQASQEISELFPAPPQLLVTASGDDILAPEYLERLAELTDELAGLEGVASVRSLTRGPPSPSGVSQSPLWGRLLLGDSPQTSLVVASVEPDAGPGLIERFEEVLERRHSPAFALRASGVPYVVELIRRHLERDLRVFSLAAVAIFGLLIAAIYRSWRIVAGTLTSCLGACAMTLAGLHLAGKSIGLLTANIVTIVFVLTLSHIVFLTANWRRSLAAGDEGPVRAAVRVTFGASFWCMVTTFLGFSSLLFASAKPLRELGFSGALGAAVAIAVAYGLYPAFLRGARPAGRTLRARPFPLRPGLAGVAVAAVLTAVAGFGLPRLETDPELPTYFAPASEIRAGIEVVDRNGGSSPLLLVVRRADGGRLDDDRGQRLLSDVQQAFDDDPAVGVSLSLPVLLAEARRVPIAFLLTWEKLVDLLASPTFDRIADSFLTDDRTRTLFFLRMRESDRGEPRRAVIDRLVAAAENSGALEVELVGGLYDLQGKLGELVARSVAGGLAGLLVLFLGVAVRVARTPRRILAMGCLAAVPVLVLGTLGLSGQPLDIISSPAVNVAVALGIDSKIHLVLAVRRRRRQGDGETVAWQNARDELWQPIAGAMLILAAGFGIFGLSSFPPTQRFGLAVAGGTVAAAAMALFVLPALATLRLRQP